jgi:uncharacterized membrane protein required for colicin V production
MNELDYIILSIVAVGVIIGLRRGFLRVVISIVGFLFIVTATGYAYAPIGRTISGAFNLGQTVMFNFAYVMMLVAMTVVVELVSRTVFEDTSLPALQGLDNLLGGIMGVLYGALWAALLLIPAEFAVVRLGGAWTEALQQSVLLPTLNQIFHTVILNIIRPLFVNGVPPIYQATYRF